MYIIKCVKLKTEQNKNKTKKKEEEVGDEGGEKEFNG